MAEERWKRAAAGTYLARARFGCERAARRLAAALQDLGSEDLLQNRDAAGRYILLDSAKNHLEQASSFLSTSMASMVAIEYLSLRGCALLPTHPVARATDLLVGPGDHYDVWLTLIRLQSAREHGQDALLAVEAAYAHLWAAQFMAIRLPPTADLHAVMQNRVDAATDRLQVQNVRLDIYNMAVLISLAAKPPACIGWK